ncbi:MAG: hypothetical protein GF408_04795 [Candidatus Omnitrophica bacterium]|nr:hypothetical protein [Candidatus Omnitrophota bacterium]
MKIAMMGAWNTDSGASIHAELVGREWVKKGIELKVYTFYRDSYHGTSITASPEEEEEYVTRCFPVYPHQDIRKSDFSGILNSDFDIFITQDLGMLPMKYLLDIFPYVKKKARTVTVIHDNKPSDKPEFFQFAWDKVVCFDDRYFDFLKNKYPEEVISVIPYPAYPKRTGNRERARKELGLPRDKKIVLSFGQAAAYSVDTLMALDRVAKDHDILMLVVSRNSAAIESFGLVKGRPGFELRVLEEFLDHRTLFKYLHASDCLLYNKPASESAVVASTVFQCLGAGCPIVARDSSFVYSFDREVLKYRNYYELEDCVRDVLERGRRFREYQDAFDGYMEENGAHAVAGKFLQLFDELLTGGRCPKEARDGS